MKENKIGPEQGLESSENATRKNAGITPEQELIYRLKTAIDDRGRYSFRLNDMAAGLAIGRGVSKDVARQAIEKSFEDHVGVSPKQYLDRHFQHRDQRVQYSGLRDSVMRGR